MPDYAKLLEQWFEDHPDMTKCRLCGTVIKKRLTVKGLCPECLQWQTKL